MEPDPIHPRVYNEANFSGSEIPMTIERECHFYLEHLHPLGFEFRDVCKHCSNSILFGEPSQGIRHCTGRYINKCLKDSNYPNQIPKTSATEVPQASSALQQLKRLFPLAFLSMSDSSFSSPLSPSSNDVATQKRQGAGRHSLASRHSLDVASLTGQLSQLSTSPRGKTPPDGKKTVVYVHMPSIRRAVDITHHTSHFSLLHLLFMCRSRIIFQQSG
jgi:hypothetical protein